MIVKSVVEKGTEFEIIFLGQRMQEKMENIVG